MDSARTDITQHQQAALRRPEAGERLDMTNGSTAKSVYALRDRYGRAVPGPPPVVSIDVSKPPVRRAMLLVHALFTEAERRGHKVDGDRIVVNGHGYEVSVTEKRDRTPHEPTARELAEQERNPWLRIPDYDHTPNGLLTIHLPQTWANPRRRRSWSDGKRGPVNAKLGQVLEEVEARAVLDEQRRVELARKEQDRERARQEAEHRAFLQSVEEHRAEHVADHVRHWRLAADIRILCDILDTTHGPGDWTRWARQHADDLDPTRAAPPPLPDQPKPPAYQEGNQLSSSRSRLPRRP